jgi:hypothetical protein
VVQGLGLAGTYENGNGAWGLMRFRVLFEQYRNEQHTKKHRRIVNVSFEILCGNTKRRSIEGSWCV